MLDSSWFLPIKLLSLMNDTCFTLKNKIDAVCKHEVQIRPKAKQFVSFSNQTGV